jgi:hypothetical protein
MWDPTEFYDAHSIFEIMLTHGTEVGL